MSDVPSTIALNHCERQFMQQLRDRGWVRAINLSAGPALLQRLIEKLWTESRGTSKDLSYRITDEGIAAKKEFIPLGGR